MANFRSQRTSVHSGYSLNALEKELVDAFQTNVVGNINLINLAPPLLGKGMSRKIVVLTGGTAVPSLVAGRNIFEIASYAISETAVDMMVAKYHAERNFSGFVLVAISPGLVDTGNIARRRSVTLITWVVLTTYSFGRRKYEKIRTYFAKLTQYAPNMAGPITVVESVNAVLCVMQKATVQEYGGKAVSHFGDRQWLQALSLAFYTYTLTRL